MNGVLGFFGRAFKALAGLFAVLILIAGFIFFGNIEGYFHFGFALLGLLIAFVFDVMTFGLIGIFAEINDDVATIKRKLECGNISKNSVTNSDSKEEVQNEEQSFLREKYKNISDLINDTEEIKKMLELGRLYGDNMFVQTFNKKAKESGIIEKDLTKEELKKLIPDFN